MRLRSGEGPRPGYGGGTSSTRRTGRCPRSRRTTGRNGSCPRRARGGSRRGPRRGRRTPPRSRGRRSRDGSSGTSAPRGSAGPREPPAPPTRGARTPAGGPSRDALGGSPRSRELRDRPVVLRDVLDGPQDGAQEDARRAEVPRLPARPHLRDCPVELADLRLEGGLRVEGIVRLHEIRREEGGHRELHDLFESATEGGDRLRELLRDPAGRLEEGQAPRRDLLPEVPDVLEHDGDDPGPDEVARLDLPDLARDAPVLGREEELADDEPVEAVDLRLHPDHLLDVPGSLAPEDAHGELLHPGRQVME